MSAQKKLIRKIAPEPVAEGVWLGEGLRNKARWECIQCGDISNYRTEALEHAYSHLCENCRENLRSNGTNLCVLCFQLLAASKGRFTQNIEAARAMGFQVSFDSYYINGVEYRGHSDLPYRASVRLSLPSYTGVLDWTALNQMMDYADSRGWTQYIESRHVQLTEGETIAERMGSMMKIILRQNAEFMIDSWNIVPQANIPEIVSRSPYLVRTAQNELQAIDLNWL